MDWMFDVKD